MPQKLKLKNNWCVYILCLNNNSFYTGITNDLNKRLAQHANKKGSKYVKSHLPFKLVYVEKWPNRSLASKREYEIKQLTRKQKMEIIRRKV